MKRGIDSAYQIDDLSTKSEASEWRLSAARPHSPELERGLQSLTNKHDARCWERTASDVQRPLRRPVPLHLLVSNRLIDPLKLTGPALVGQLERCLRFFNCTMDLGDCIMKSEVTKMMRRYDYVSAASVLLNNIMFPLYTSTVLAQSRSICVSSSPSLFALPLRTSQTAAAEAQR